MGQETTVFFAGKATNTLGEKIVSASSNTLANVEYKRFSDGEFKTQLGANVRGRKVILIQSTHATERSAADNLWELLMLTDAAKRASAKEIIAVIPYFGNARQERKDQPRAPITAKLCADMLTVAGVHKIITMDLHAEAIQGFFNISVDNLFASYLFVDIIKNLPTDNLMFASADASGAKRVTKYAKYFKKGMIICNKERPEANEVENITVLGDPKDKDIVIIDDIIDTAGTICKVSEAIIEKGAKSVSVFASHGVCSGNAYENIANSPIEKCYVTDSLPNCREYLEKNEFPKLKIVGCRKLFAKAIVNHIIGESVNQLFLF